MKVLVVDDTILFRKIISDALEQIPGVEVVGKAGNGKSALMRIRDLNPDLITLDIEMPEMNGIEVLEIIKREKIDVGVIVLSAFTIKGGEMTVKALQRGAFDFITKPESGTPEQNRKAIGNALSPVLAAWEHKKNQNRKVSALSGKSAYAPHSLEDLDLYIRNMKDLNKPEIVLVGVSTGGPPALAEVLPRIPEEIGVPILIVQHMPPLFTKALAKSLDAKCRIGVKEAEEGESLAPGMAYIAPGGKQMKISTAPGGRNYRISLTEDPAENNCKPSVDYLFRSAVSHFPGRILAVVMTGMGNDGKTGMRLIKRQGGMTIAQDKASCVVYGMPMEVVKAGAAELILPLRMIPDAIEKTIRLADSKCRK